MPPFAVNGVFPVTPRPLAPGAVQKTSQGPSHWMLAGKLLVDLDQVGPVSQRPEIVQAIQRRLDARIETLVVLFGILFVVGEVGLLEQRHQAIEPPFFRRRRRCRRFRRPHRLRGRHRG